jgi:hypothetical protein
MPLTFNLVLNIHLQQIVDILDVKQVTIKKNKNLNKFYLNLMQFFSIFHHLTLSKFF